MAHIDPMGMALIKMIKEHEVNGKILYPIDELVDFCNRSLRIAEQVGNEGFVIAPNCHLYSYEEQEKLRAFCGVTRHFVEYYPENRDKAWRYITGMSYETLKGALDTITKDLADKTTKKPTTH